MILALLVLAIWHPGRILRGPESDFEQMRAEKKAEKKAGKVAKKEAKIVAKMETKQAKREQKQRKKEAKQAKKNSRRGGKGVSDNHEFIEVELESRSRHDNFSEASDTIHHRY